MTQARQTIDALVERLKDANPTVDKIAHILGSPRFEKSGATVRIDSPPFESADINEYEGVIRIRFNMSVGMWRLKDITEDVDAWLFGPALPDSGRMEVARDWNLKHLMVRCITGIEAEGEVGSRLVSEVRCQVTSE